MVGATPISSTVPGQKLIAPVWHTALLVVIFLGITVAGGLFQRHAQSTPGALQQHPNVVPLYLSVIAVEGLLLYGVWAGIKLRGGHLRDLIGEKWKNPQAVLTDFVLATVVWILWLGIQLAFRGYFQKQFQAMTGSASASVILQGILFGISHGYQGLRAILMIMLFGFLYGMLAFWRKSLRPGIILHAWSDVYAGYLFQYLHL